MWGNPDSLLEININNVSKKINGLKVFCVEPKYVVITKETLEAIENSLLYKTIRELEGYYKKQKTICGLNIALCENLKFGEFEVR